MPRSSLYKILSGHAEKLNENAEKNFFIQNWMEIPWEEL